MPAGVSNHAAAAAPAEGGQQRQGGQAQAQEAGANGTSTKRNGDVPPWNGPEQAASSSAANGDPFTTQLDGNAVPFAPSSPSGHAGRISELNDASEAEPRAVIVSSTLRSVHANGSNGHDMPIQPPVGTAPVSSRAPVIFSTDVGPHVTPPGGHYMKLDNFPSSELDGVFKRLCQEEPYCWNTKIRSMVCPPVAGSPYVTIWLSFNDMRDAANAIEEVTHLSPRSPLSYISYPEFLIGSRANGPRGLQEETSYFDGQLVLKATFFDHGKEFNATGLYEGIVGLCKNVGEFVGVAERIVDARIRHYHVEFYKISDAKYMVEQADEEPPIVIKGWSVSITEIPDGKAENTHHPLATPQKLQYTNGDTAQISSPTGRTTWTFNQRGHPVAMPAHNQLPKIASITAGISLTPAGRRLRGSDPAPTTPASCVADVAYMQRSGTWPSADKPPKSVPYTRRKMPDFHPNVINVERIEGGIDVRTTIMVRNVPNDMSADELKGVVDKVCRGRYDFIYLRFDFAKNKNVGYAFVNFLAPNDVLTFFYAYTGKEYIEGMGSRSGRSPRLGEIAYATCQGQDCAIEKFRNSSIMCEYPGYRPRLFWTEEDAPMPALISQERKFPGINNLSKHNRSKDNAAQIGLYAPKSRHGAIITRNSQFDRGTPAQMQEDAMFQHQQMMQQPFAHQPMGQQPFGYGYNDGGYAFGNQHMSMPMGMGMGMSMGMSMGTPVGNYPMMYDPGQQFHASQTAMNGSPNAYAPSAPAFHGNPGPVMASTFTGSPAPTTHTTFKPSRLRTITEGRLGMPPRRRITVRPPRDQETAEREIAEGQRVQAEYDARSAQIAELQAEQDAAIHRRIVPRFMDDGENEEDRNDSANGGYNDGYGEEHH